MFSQAIYDQLLASCEMYFAFLVEQGCDEDLAADRTFDALDSAVEQKHHVFDQRDRAFEESLAQTIERG
ncbi:hypothetical protein [Atopobium fossor]|uniref:hypothetical protein n=1 Tax=Atopobium fossor TaxID=39487 RepID=UPI00042206D6|nr:hypothetical protein [Atopobium fossor]